MSKSKKCSSYIIARPRKAQRKVSHGQVGVCPLTICETLRKFLNIWDKRQISCVSHVSTWVVSKGTGRFVLDCLSPSVCRANSLCRQKQYLPMEQRGSLPTVCYKRSGFLNLAFHIREITHWVCPHEPEPLYRTPVGLGLGGGGWARNRKESRSSHCLL